MASSPRRGLAFSLESTSRSSSSAEGSLAPRLGQLSVSRISPGDQTAASEVRIDTPNLWAYTSRGAVPHLTRDNVARSSAIKGIHVPVESYLESNPSIPLVPCLYPSSRPAHDFHGFDPLQTIVSVGLRDPDSTTILRANGNNYVTAVGVQGSKQVIPKSYHEWATAMRPDIIFALPDTPNTAPPYSQKRLTKSNERTLRWLTDFVTSLHSSPPSSTAPAEDADEPAIFIHLQGSSIPAARSAFTQSLLEPLLGREASLLPSLSSIDEAVSGYVIDLLPIRLSLSSSSSPSQARAPLQPEVLTPLIHASLKDLPSTKPRLVTGVSTPHEILRLIKDGGIDLFDSYWAQSAANHGIALDFTFPAPPSAGGEREEMEGKGRHGYCALNLYNERYAMDFGRLSTELLTPFDVHSQSQGGEAEAGKEGVVCKCIACSPEISSAPIKHSSLDHDASPPLPSLSSSSSTTPLPSPEPNTAQGPTPTKHFTRAYIHHLLHTHEMSAHTLLVAHNLSVLEHFFAGIRGVLSSPDSNERFEAEVARFAEMYDEHLLWGEGGEGRKEGILEEGERRWREVEMLRGKGRLKREKDAAAVAGTAPSSVVPVMGDERGSLEAATEAVEKATLGEGTAVLSEGDTLDAGVDA